MNALMEKLQKIFTQETNCTKNLNQSDCMVIKKFIKKCETQFKI